MAANKTGMQKALARLLASRNRQEPTRLTLCGPPSERFSRLLTLIAPESGLMKARLTVGRRADWRHFVASSRNAAATARRRNGHFGRTATRRVGSGRVTRSIARSGFGRDTPKAWCPAARTSRGCFGGVGSRARTRRGTTTRPPASGRSDRCESPACGTCEQRSSRFDLYARGRYLHRGGA